MGSFSIRMGTVFLVVIVILVFLSGCSSSDDHTVVGTWKWEMTQGATSSLAVVTFRADGTGQYKFDTTTPGYSQMDWHISYPFTWRVADEHYAGSYVKAIVIVSDKSSLDTQQFIYDTNRDQLTLSAQDFVRVS